MSVKQTPNCGAQWRLALKNKTRLQCASRDIIFCFSPMYKCRMRVMSAVALPNKVPAVAAAECEATRPSVVRPYWLLGRLGFSCWPDCTDACSTSRSVDTTPAHPSSFLASVTLSPVTHTLARSLRQAGPPIFSQLLIPWLSFAFGYLPFSSVSPCLLCTRERPAARHPSWACTAERRRPRNNRL